MAWIDACSHAVLSAQILLNMYRVITTSGDVEDEWAKLDISDLEEEVAHLKGIINSIMWDEQAGFYFDRKYALSSFF